ncbi:hypothetical protein GCM10023264_28930 [Sphingomonas daechungensis]
MQAANGNGDLWNDQQETDEAGEDPAHPKQRPDYAGHGVGNDHEREEEPELLSRRPSRKVRIFLERLTR